MRRETSGLFRDAALAFFVVGNLVFGLPPAPAAADESTSIAWRDDYGRAMTEARTRNRAVWIQFTGPWCPWCVRMQQDTFPHPQVVGLSREALVPVLLRSDVHEEIALRFGLTGLPATILVSPKGEILAKHEGYLDPATFHAYVVSTLNRFGLLHPPQPKRPPLAPAPLALAGYCPVSLVVDHRLTSGKQELSLQHDGRQYRFATDESRARFRKQPELFVPVNAGRCPVRQVDEAKTQLGDPHYGVLYEGHLYVCANEASRKLFLEKPERYAHVDVADRGFCPHCWTRENLLVRGRAEHSLTRAGQRFFFPDDVHLEAFRASTESLRR